MNNISEILLIIIFLKYVSLSSGLNENIYLFLFSLASRYSTLKARLLQTIQSHLSKKNILTFVNMTVISNNTKIFGKMSNKSKIPFKQQNLVLLVSNFVFKLAKLSS